MTRYVLPVLRMSSCFHTVGFMVRHVYSQAARAYRNSQDYCIDSIQVLLNDIGQQVHIVVMPQSEVC